MTTQQTIDRARREADLAPRSGLISVDVVRGLLDAIDDGDLLTLDDLRSACRKRYGHEADEVFAELCHGLEPDLPEPKAEPCRLCDGHGAYLNDGTAPADECPACQGSGEAGA